MKRKINSRLYFIGLVATVLSALLITFSFYRMTEERGWNQLKDMSQVFANNAGDMNTLRKMAGGINNHYRVTVINREGTVEYDSRVSLSQLGNHNDREEVKNARKDGTSHTVRMSDTIGKKTLYYATDVGQGTILRLAMDTDNITTTFASVIPLILIVAFCAFIICILISRKLTDGLLEPITEMAAGNMNVAYPELEPFAKSIKEREAVEKMKQEFTANVSHELKTPLTSISGYAELIETGMAKPEDIKKFAQKIHVESGRLIVLIGDIMKLSELEEPGSLCEFQPVDLVELARGCANSLEIPALKKRIKINVTGNPTSILGDRKLLDEMVYNLCDNAIRYNVPYGYVNVEIGEKEHIPWISVSDNGIGIPDDKQDQIFQRFYRVDKSRSKETGGTGLGLSIVKHICELHGAQITVHSAESKGTTILIEFLFKK